MCTHASVVRRWYGDSLRGLWLASALSCKQRIEPRKYVVDMSSPNIAKPFHVGHLRSTLVGQFTANVLQLAGHKVYRLNYLGDWGSQFGVLARGFQKYGTMDMFSDDTPSTSKLMHLYEVYVKANQDQDPEFVQESRELFARMENGDPEALKFWKTSKEVSISAFKRLYETLNISFDTWDGESMYRNEHCSIYRKEWEDKGLLKISEGSAGIWGSSEKWRALFKSDGCSLYLTRDVVAALDRVKRFSPNKLMVRFPYTFLWYLLRQFTNAILYVVEHGQFEHFVGLKEALNKLEYNDVSEMVEHVPFGRITGMRTRDGTAVFVDDLINEGMKLSLPILLHPTSRLSDQSQEVKDQAIHNFAVSSLIVNILSKKRKSGFKFNWKNALKIKGTGAAPYLHYQHARLCTLKSQFNKTLGPLLDSDCLDSLNNCPDAQRLIGSLEGLSEGLRVSYETLDSAPFLWATFDLGQTLGSVNRTMKVKDVEYCIAKPRFVLLQLCKNVIAEALTLVGVNPMQVM